MAANYHRGDHMTESGLKATERRNPRSLDVDSLEPAALVDLFVAEDALVPRAVGRAGREVALVIGMVETAFRGGGRLFYVGAGTSGRLGVLDASECPPTFGTPPDLVQGIIAGGQRALTQPVEGAEDDPAAGAASLMERGVTAADVVVGIAASGSTPFVAGALQHARSNGTATALITCATPATVVASNCDVVILLDVGPELLTGSTRLKAGTATKLVLNLITTGAMIRMGKTYGNLMVDLQASNAKLRERGRRIVMETVGVSADQAAAAIDAAAGSVRTAIAMLKLDVAREEAEIALAGVGGRLREIIGPPPQLEE